MVWTGAFIHYDLVYKDVTSFCAMAATSPCLCTTSFNSHPVGNPEESASFCVVYNCSGGGTISYMDHLVTTSTRVYAPLVTFATTHLPVAHVKWE